MMQAPALFTTNAPDWMDVFMYDDGDGKYRVVFLNAMEKYYECEVKDIEINIRNKDISTAVSAKYGNTLPVEKTNNGIKIRIDKIKDFEMIALFSYTLSSSEHRIFPLDFLRQTPKPPADKNESM